jgi:hypothetical protein
MHPGYQADTPFVGGCFTHQTGNLISGGESLFPNELYRQIPARVQAGDNLLCIRGDLRESFRTVEML